MKRFGVLAALAIGAAGLLLVARETAAEDAHPLVTGRALSPVGAPAVDAGMPRMGDSLVRVAEADGGAPDGAPGIAAALAAPGAVDASLAGAWGTPPAPVFTTTSGLSPAGEVVFAWMKAARHHGIELAPEAALTTFAAAPAEVVPAPPTVAPDDVRAAWEASAGAPAERRFDLAVEALKRRLPALGARPVHTTVDPAARAAAEIALGRGLAKLVAELPSRPRQAGVLEDVKENRYLSPDVLWRGVPVPPATPEALKAAFDAARSGALEGHLAGLEPKAPQYALLVKAAERYEGYCAAGEWGTIATPKNQKAAEADATLAGKLQARLAREGFYQGAPTGVIDDATNAALTAFRDARQVPQTVHDQGPLSDPQLYAALNVPCGERLVTLELNVRRWRVSGWNGEPTRVQVNLAGQELRYYRDDALAMFQRTVVGSSKWYFDPTTKHKIYMNATPILKDHIARIVLNPEWSVPPRIVRNELDGAVAKDATYVDQHHFRVVQLPNGQHGFIQDPGPWNALGVIKILFPNSESVYLHDTPSKNAFKLAVRALSHGCVRVQNALDLGVALLKADADASHGTFDEDDFRKHAGYGGSRVTELKQLVPVFLEYYTASVDEQGVVHFHPDIYGYDAETLGVVASGAAPIVNGQGP